MFVKDMDSGEVKRIEYISDDPQLSGLSADGRYIIFKNPVAVYTYGPLYELPEPQKQPSLNPAVFELLLLSRKPDLVPFEFPKPSVSRGSSSSVIVYAQQGSEPSEFLTAPE